MKYQMVMFSIVAVVFSVTIIGCKAESIPPKEPQTPPVTPPAPSIPVSQPITREQAIEKAKRGLNPSVVNRADIKAEIHVWYWEIVFDNINAKADELMPYPLKGPPPTPQGQIVTDPYPGIWQSVVITIHVDTGDLRSASARRAPKPGPYISQSQAIESAREPALRFTSEDRTWVEKAKVEAYLQGDNWIVLFWEEGSKDKRLWALVDAVTGTTHGVGRS